MTNRVVPDQTPRSVASDLMLSQECLSEYVKHGNSINSDHYGSAVVRSAQKIYYEHEIVTNTLDCPTDIEST